MTCRAPVLLAVAFCAAPGAARAQTMLDQQQQLIDIHSLLLDLPPLQAPAALSSGTLGVSLEGVTIPVIDGTTGSKTQITASDRVRLYPRPRLMLGLPAPRRFRAFVGLSYIPPFEIRDVSTNYIAGEGGFGFAPGVFRVGARLHGLYAIAKSPVTDPNTRDTLETKEWGADLAVGARLRWKELDLDLEPYAGAGAVSLEGRFRVTSDGTILRSDYTGAAVHAGLRLVFRSRWEVVTELDAYPGRLVHTDFRVGYLFGLFGG
jgi:hypothetical protein